jgi:hypothetical protein
MASPAVERDTITVDLLNDLKDGSHLKSLLGTNQNAILAITSELAQFATQPIQSAVGSRPAQIKILAPANLEDQHRDRVFSFANGKLHCLHQRHKYKVYDRKKHRIE